MNDSELNGRLEFVRRAERLKDTVRSGFTTEGRTESVADHTWRLTLLAITFADLLPGIDLLRLLKICILHDLGEAVDGDIPAPSQVGLKSKSDKERNDLESLMNSLPRHVRSDFLSLWDDYEYLQSYEAQVAKALDKIETLMQHNQGKNPESFDYSFNLDYGRQYTDAIPLTAQIRALVDSETSKLNTRPAKYGMTQRGIARQLAAESIRAGDPLAWFETLYAQAIGNNSVIPWAEMTVNPNLSAWLERQQISGVGRSALVVGCGLGDDAEALASLGFRVTAFDISPTCIEWCRCRFPDSVVEYCVADLFAPPSSWPRTFELVLESYTLQVLPNDVFPAAIRQIANFVATDGTLLVISRGRDETNDPGKMPWPLLRSDLAEFTKVGLHEVVFEDYIEAEDPPVRRFRVEYRRTPG